MKNKHFVLAFLFACLYGNHAFAQYSFLSVFGANASACSPNNRMSCVVPPTASAFTGIAALSDGSPLAPTLQDVYKNSIYNNSGQLLFSVNADGVYAQDGYQLYQFIYSGTWLDYTPPGCAYDYYIKVTSAISEIAIVPVHCQPNQYYAIFWATTSDHTCIGACPVSLVAYKITINPATYPAHGAYTVTPYVLNVPTCSGGYSDFGNASSSPGAFCLAADNFNSDGSRDIYTLDPYFDPSCGCYDQSEIRKWTIDASGNLPTASTVIYPYTGATPLLFSNLFKAKILTMPAPVGSGYTGMHKYFCFGGINGTSYGGTLQTYDLTTNQVTTSYNAPLITCPHPSTETPASAVAGYQQLGGFEYLPSPINEMMFTFADYSFSTIATGAGVPTGGVCYAPAPGPASYTMTVMPSSSENYLFSDLERDRNGDLFMVNMDLTTYDGKLYYLPTSTIPSVTALIAATPSQVSIPACSAYPYIPVLNNQLLANEPNSPYYLGTQIRGEDYSNSGNPDIMDYTVPPSSTVSWSPTSNPVHDAEYGVGSATSVPSLNVGNIIVSHTSELDVSNMALNFSPGTAATIDPAVSSGGSGGWLALYNAILTINSSCTNTTWAGITVLGNPGYLQSLAWGGPQSQGVLWMGGSTISYADVGVQNGSGPTTSGGIIMIDGTPSTFYNNKLAVQLWPYHNYSIGGIEENSLEWFNGCTFNTDAAAWFPVTYYAQVQGINGTDFHQCHFYNNTGATMAAAVMDGNSSIIYNNNTVGSFSTTYKSFQYGFYDVGYSGTTTSNLIANTFNNCQWGYVADGTVAPYLLQNTFNIPAYSGIVGGAPPYYPGTDVLMVNDQNIGAFMFGATPYYMVSNTFKGASSGYYPYTSGTIEYSTGSGDNQVTDNSFTGLGAAMNSNFVNNAGSSSVYSGLQYLCNTTASNDYDINVIGNNTANGGINPLQATSSGSATFDLAAGNTFTGTRSVYDQQLFLEYRYNPSGTDESPVAYWGPVVFLPSPKAHCYAVSNTTSTGAYSIGAAGSYSVGSPDGPGGSADIGLNYSIAIANVNYYMTDTAPHRDSVYYWAGQMNSPYGDLLIANMLIEDSLVDSADTVYNHIAYKFGLQGPELNDFVQGRSLMDILIAKREGDNNLYKLSASQISTLQSVKANATMWAHVRAENWLNTVTGEALVDTFLYPPADTSADTSGGGGEGGRFSHNPTITNSPAISNMVFPNPVHDLVQVIYTAKTNDGVMIQIEDVSGRKIISQQINSGVQTAIDMSNLVPGIYIYRISEGSRVTMIGKITKD